MFVDFDFRITPTKVHSAYYLLQSPVGVLTHQNGRSCWGLLLKTQGKTYYTQEGKQFLSDKNHVVLLPQNGKYTWKCVEPGVCVMVNFYAPQEGTAIQSFEVADSSFILSVFSQLERLDLDDPLSHLAAMQQLYGILFFLAKTVHKKYIPKDKRRRLAPAMDHMLENYSDPQITNSSLAAMCGMSEVYFRKSFEAVFDSPPIRYLHRLRISKAKAMLLGDYDSVGQIAESVGYSSVYHFSKMFKIYTGMSPTEYVKASRK